MKKLILFVSFIFIASLCFGQNMITNGDLELWTTGVPDDWGKVENITQESTIIHGGTYSAAHQSAGSTKDFGHEYTTGITAGNDYTISYYYLDNDDHARTRLWSYWKNATGGSVGSVIDIPYSVDDPNWIHYSNVVTAPVGATQFYFEVRAYKESNGDYGGYVYYDDFSFINEGGATPAIEKAYAISSDELEVFYNLDLTTVTASDFELTGTATITFTNATIDGTNAKLVHLSGASTAMADDNTLDALSDGAKSTYDFYAGITSISYTNTLNPGGLIDDTHIATFTGIISANDANNSVWVSDATGAYNGVVIYSYSFHALVDVGDEVLITANRTTYNGLTELEYPTLISTISTGNAPYGPTVINGSDINETIAVDTNPAESWEGQFVKIENFYVDSYSSADYEYRCMWSGAKTDYYFIVGDNVDYHFGTFLLIVGATYQDIQGVVDWDNYGSFYRINPRDAGDATLPVELSSFTALFANEFVTIQWATASETDVIGFNIYRAHEDDFSDAEQINMSLIPGHGTTTEPNEYSFEDRSADALYSTYYYWLESVNLGGTTDIYGSIQYDPVDVDGDGQLNTIVHSFLNDIYPNPVSLGQNVTFKFTIGGLEGTLRPVSLNIYDIKGKLVQKVINEDMMVDDDCTEVWQINDLANGVYFYQLKTENYQETKKLLIQ